LPGTGEAPGPCVSVNIRSSRCNLTEFNPRAEMPTAQLAAFNFVHNQVIVTTITANSDTELSAHGHKTHRILNFISGFNKHKILFL